MLCDLRPGVRRNVKIARWLTGIVGTAGSVLGYATGASMVAGAATGAISLGLIAGPALVGGSIAGLGTVGWYRWLYRSAVDKARNKMREALAAVAATVRGEELFGSLPERPQPPTELSPGEAAAAFGRPPTR